MIGDGNPVQIKFEIPDQLFERCEKAWREFGGGPESSWHEWMEGLLLKALSLHETEREKLAQIQHKGDGARARAARRGGRLGVQDGFGQL